MNVLDDILRAKGSEIDALRSRARDLQARARDAAPARDFSGALRRAHVVAVVTEVKRRSPSAGWIRERLDAAVIARAYERAGAAAVSVLTDGPFFGGSLDDLANARKAVALPVLRKDFVLDPVQVWEARAAGADAVLLIARVLDDAALSGLIDTCAAAGLDALVEVHDETEARRALSLGARVIGVNNRDLDRFVTDVSVSLRLAPLFPPAVVLLAESGIAGREDVARLGSAGFDAVLVGESLVRAPDPGAAVAALIGVERRDRGREAAWT